MKGNLKYLCLPFILIAATTFAQKSERKTVLFICEHGSAKSIVAASHFNRLARQAGLDVKVISRGTNPDKAVPEKVNQFLVQDGLEKYRGVPQKLSDRDIKDADYVVAFSLLPDNMQKPLNLETWNIPSFEAGYPTARDSILTNLRKIIKKIQSDTQK